MKKILTIGCTHGFHKELIIPNDIDMIIHTGDFTNSKSPMMNEPEAHDFIDWYYKLDIQYRVLICGNHDTSIEKRLITPEYIKNLGIIYLEHESIEIEGIKLFGSPYSKEFHNWAFNIRPDRFYDLYQQIPEDTDIVITHQPPKGILDLALDNDKNLEFCGDKSLLNRIGNIKPKFHLFSHIHDNNNCYNKGIRQFPGHRTTYVNTSCVTDRHFDLGLTSQGIVIEI